MRWQINSRALILFIIFLLAGVGWGAVDTLNSGDLPYTCTLTGSNFSETLYVNGKISLSSGDAITMTNCHDVVFRGLNYTGDGSYPDTIAYGTGNGDNNNALYGYGIGNYVDSGSVYNIKFEGIVFFHGASTDDCSSNDALFWAGWSDVTFIDCRFYVRGANGNCIDRYSSAYPTWNIKFDSCYIDGKSIGGASRMNYDFAAVKFEDNIHAASTRTSLGLEEGNWNLWFRKCTILSPHAGIAGGGGKVWIDTCTFIVDARNDSSTADNHGSARCTANSFGVDWHEIKGGSRIYGCTFRSGTSYAGCNGAVLMQVAQGTPTDTVEVAYNFADSITRGYDHEYDYMVVSGYRSRWGNRYVHQHHNKWHVMAGDTSLSYMGDACVGVDFYAEDEGNGNGCDGGWNTSNLADSFCIHENNEIKAVLVGNNYDNAIGSGAYGVRFATFESYLYPLVTSDHGVYDDTLRLYASQSNPPTTAKCGIYGFNGITDPDTSISWFSSPGKYFYRWIKSDAYGNRDTTAVDSVTLTSEHLYKWRDAGNVWRYNNITAGRGAYYPLSWYAFRHHQTGFLAEGDTIALIDSGFSGIDPRLIHSPYDGLHDDDSNNVWLDIYKPGVADDSIYINANNGETEYRFKYTLRLYIKGTNGYMVKDQQVKFVSNVHTADTTYDTTNASGYVTQILESYVECENSADTSYSWTAISGDSSMSITLSPNVYDTLIINEIGNVIPKPDTIVGEFIHASSGQIIMNKAGYDHDHPLKYQLDTLVTFRDDWPVSQKLWDYRWNTSCNQSWGGSRSWNYLAGSEYYDNGYMIGATNDYDWDKTSGCISPENYEDRFSFPCSLFIPAYCTRDTAHAWGKIMLPHYRIDSDLDPDTQLVDLNYVIFKSSAFWIGGAGTYYSDYKSQVEEAMDSMANYPHKVFCIWTGTPTSGTEGGSPDSTDRDKALQFAYWLQDTASVDAPDNVLTWSGIYLGLVQQNSGSDYLEYKDEYTNDDLHPNQTGATVAQDSVVNWFDRFFDYLETYYDTTTSPDPALSHTIAELSTSYDNIRVRNDLTEANGANADTLRIYCGNETPIVIVNPSDPVDTGFYSLTDDSTYELWSIAIDTANELTSYSDTIESTTDTIPDTTLTQALICNDTTYNSLLLSVDFTLALTVVDTVIFYISTDTFTTILDSAVYASPTDPETHTFEGLDELTDYQVHCKAWDESTGKTDYSDTLHLVTLEDVGYVCIGFDGDYDEQMNLQTYERSTVFTTTDSGWLDSAGLLMDCVVSDTTYHVRAALFLLEDSSFVDSTEHYLVSSTFDTAWVYFNFVGNALVHASTEYFLTISGDSTVAGHSVNVFRDNNESGWTYYYKAKPEDEQMDAWPSKYTPDGSFANRAIFCQFCYSDTAQSEPEDTASLSISIAFLDTNNTSVRLRVDWNDENTTADSLKFYCDNGDSIILGSFSDPQDTGFYGLTKNTPYDFWAILYDTDSSLTEYSETLTVTTLDLDTTLTQDVSCTDTSYNTLTLATDITVENCTVDSLQFQISTDDFTNIDTFVVVASDDTLYQFTGLTEETEYDMRVVAYADCENDTSATVTVTTESEPEAPASVIYLPFYTKD